jgi:hypothetical protein
MPANSGNLISTLVAGGTVVGSSSGTSLIVSSGDGAALFASITAFPYYITAFPSGVRPTKSNAEIMKVTARSTDTLTVTRNAGSNGSLQSVITTGWQVVLGITKELIDELAGLAVTSGVIAPVGSRAAYVGDGIADQTAFNNSMIASMGVHRARAGGYVASNHILPLTSRTLEGEDKATNIVFAQQKVIKIDQQSNVKVRNLAIDTTANNAIADLNTRRNTYAVYIDRSSDVDLKELWIETYAYGVFLTNQTAGTDVVRFRFRDLWIRGACQNDLIGGGPGTDTATVGEFIIDGCFLKQDGTLTNPGTYLNCIDIVAQQKSTITNTETYGGVLLGGEKIPHNYVNINDLIINAPVGLDPTITVGQLAILCASNTTPQQSADSSNINISNFNILSGNLFIQGQSVTSNRTKLFNITNGNINVNASASYPDHTYGLNFNYVSNGTVTGVTVRNGVRGASLTNANDITFVDCDFTGCTTPIVLSGSCSNITGRNCKGINPDIIAASRNITGAITFTRADGLIQPCTFTGNTTGTLTNGFFIGDVIVREFTMGGSGSYTYTKGSNEKLVGGGFTPTASVGAKDTLTQRWNGTNWVEVGRSMNIS